MKLSRIILFAILCDALFSIACGLQPPQQGTWSQDDKFQHKTTPAVKEPQEKPADTVR